MAASSITYQQSPHPPCGVPLAQTGVFIISVPRIAMKATGPGRYSCKLAGDPLCRDEIVVGPCAEQVIGSTALAPSPARYLGRPVAGASMGDTVTHADSRRWRVFTTCIEDRECIALEREFEVGFGCLNDRSRPGSVTKLQLALTSSADIGVLRKAPSTDLLKDGVEMQLRSDVLTDIAAALVHLEAHVRYDSPVIILTGASAGGSLANGENRSQSAISDSDDH